MTSPQPDPAGSRGFMGDHAPRTPPPRCPARHGNGGDITTAPFTFVVGNGLRGIHGQPAMIQAHGYFTAPGTGHTGDVLQTGSVEVPASSPVGEAIRQVAADPASQAQVAAILRGNAVRCPCTATSACPALDAEHLLLALCRVTRPNPGPGKPHAPAPAAPHAPGTDHLLTARCPLDCLRPHLSAHAYNPLRRELPVLLQRPATVGDIARMCQHHQLRHIRNLGRRRIGEIELTLMLHGLLTLPPEPQDRR